MTRAARALGRTVRSHLRDPFSKPNPYIHLESWDYQEPIVAPHIRTEDVVLDIGSGNHPVPRADILADYFLEDDFHRSGGVVDDRPLIACTVERLPFLSKSIDFAICSHVLEHVAHPAVAGRELARIAKSGYIETPSYGKDIWVGSGYMHEWQVVEFEGTMHFFQYSKRQHEAHVTSPVMELWMSRSYHPWQTFFWERQDLFNAMQIWHEEPAIVEHRRARSRVRDAVRHPWVPVASESLPDTPACLTDVEVRLLERCLATPDGTRPMLLRGDCFESQDGAVTYPVRGKRVYCELAGGAGLR